MKLNALARGYLEEARIRLRVARSAYREGKWSYCVRQCQECVELSLKASLRLVGIEYPKDHDVSDILLEMRERFPEWFREEAEALARASRELADKRGPSMYGDESASIPPSRLFQAQDAKIALKQAALAHRLGSKLARSGRTKRLPLPR